MKQKFTQNFQMKKRKEKSKIERKGNYSKKTVGKQKCVVESVSTGQNLIVFDLELIF